MDQLWCGVAVKLNSIQLYALTSEYSEAKIEEIYSDLGNEMSRIPGREITIMIGIFNAKTSSLK